MEVDYILKKFREIGINLSTKEAEALTKVHKTYFKTIIRKLKPPPPELPTATKGTANILWYIYKTIKNKHGKINPKKTYNIKLNGYSIFVLKKLAEHIYEKLQ